MGHKHGSLSFFAPVYYNNIMLKAIYYSYFGYPHYSTRVKEWINYYRQHYADYLKTPHWSQLRIKYLNGNATCWICEQKIGLLLHHVRYDNLFNEKLYRDVYILCYTCHTRTHFTLLLKRKIALTYNSLVVRMYFLKYTYRIRSFRFSYLFR
jgi:hypothetical protein